MKALTICQPYAALICLPATDWRQKQVENRKWFTNYRGPLLIHAGLSRDWLKIDRDFPAVEELYGLPIADMAFGAVVAVANLAACVNGSDPRCSSYQHGVRRFPWLREHFHAEAGYWWWVLTDITTLVKPIPCRGAQGLFEVPDDVAKQVNG